MLRLMRLIISIFYLSEKFKNLKKLLINFENFFGFLLFFILSLYDK